MPVTPAHRNLATYARRDGRDSDAPPAGEETEPLRMLLFSVSAAQDRDRGIIVDGRDVR